MERLQEDWQHEYRATPLEYPISDNNRKATYDQFMSLRDTMVYSNKFYWNNAWRSLIIWMKTDGNPTNTIEIREPNICDMRFEPDWWVSGQVKWKFISTGEHPLSPISCEINTKWRYIIQHKEQFNNIDSNITRIHTYVVHHKSDWTTQDRAVFDWEWDTPWEIKRVTAFGYLECDLNKWDWLELKIESSSWTDISSELAPNSNRWMVEYKDLAYNI